MSVDTATSQLLALLTRHWNVKRLLRELKSATPDDLILDSEITWRVKNGRYSPDVYVFAPGAHLLELLITQNRAVAKADLPSEDLLRIVQAVYDVYDRTGVSPYQGISRKTNQTAFSKMFERLGRYSDTSELLRVIEQRSGSVLQDITTPGLVQTLLQATWFFDKFSTFDENLPSLIRCTQNLLLDSNVRSQLFSYTLSVLSKKSGVDDSTLRKCSKLGFWFDKKDLPESIQLPDNLALFPALPTHSKSAAYSQQNQSRSHCLDTALRLAVDSWGPEETFARCANPTELLQVIDQQYAAMSVRITDSLSNFFSLCTALPKNIFDRKFASASREHRPINDLTAVERRFEIVEAILSKDQRRLKDLIDATVPLSVPIPKTTPTGIRFTGLEVNLILHGMTELYDRIDWSVANLCRTQPFPGVLYATAKEFRELMGTTSTSRAKLLPEKAPKLLRVISDCCTHLSTDLSEQESRLFANHVIPVLLALCDRASISLVDSVIGKLSSLSSTDPELQRALGDGVSQFYQLQKAPEVLRQLLDRLEKHGVCLGLDAAETFFTATKDTDTAFNFFAQLSPAELKLAIRVSKRAVLSTPEYFETYVKANPELLTIPTQLTESAYDLGPAIFRVLSQEPNPDQLIKAIDAVPQSFDWSQLTSTCRGALHFLAMNTGLSEMGRVFQALRQRTTQADRDLSLVSPLGYALQHSATDVLEEFGKLVAPDVMAAEFSQSIIDHGSLEKLRVFLQLAESRPFDSGFVFCQLQLAGEAKLLGASTAASRLFQYLGETAATSKLAETAFFRSLDYACPAFVTGFLRVRPEYATECSEKLGKFLEANSAHPSSIAPLIMVLDTTGMPGELLQSVSAAAWKTLLTSIDVPADLRYRFHGLYTEVKAAREHEISLQELRQVSAANLKTTAKARV